MEDYIVKDPFSTEFRFGRFNAATAMPRNILNLSGPTLMQAVVKKVGDISDLSGPIALKPLM